MLAPAFMARVPPMDAAAEAGNNTGLRINADAVLRPHVATAESPAIEAKFTRLSSCPASLGFHRAGPIPPVSAHRSHRVDVLGYRVVHRQAY